MWSRELPRSFGSSDVGKWPLVARKTASEAAFDGLAYDALALAVAVFVGGVDQVDAGVERLMDYADDSSSRVNSPKFQAPGIAARL